MFPNYFELTPALDKEDKSHYPCQESKIYTLLYQSNHIKKRLPPLGQKNWARFQKQEKKIACICMESNLTASSSFHKQREIGEGQTAGWYVKASIISNVFLLQKVLEEQKLAFSRR